MLPQKSSKMSAIYEFKFSHIKSIIFRRFFRCHICAFIPRVYLMIKYAFSFCMRTKAQSLKLEMCVRDVFLERV